jgi:outer membrane protein OmpU
MKNILLTTTALVAFAGAAAADGHTSVSFAGEASVEYNSDAGYSTAAEMTATGSATLDNGFTASTSLTVDAVAGTISAGSISLSSDTASLTFGTELDGAVFTAVGDDYAIGDDGEEGVAEGLVASVTMGETTLTVSAPMGATIETADVEVGVTTSAAGWSLGFGLANDAYAMTAAGTAGGADIGFGMSSDSEWDVSVAYPVGAVTVSASTDEAEAWTVGAAYAADGVSAGFELNADESWEVTAGYAADGVTVAAAFTDTSVMTLGATYDMGNGLTVGAGIEDTVNYAFASYDLGGGANAFVDYTDAAAALEEVGPSERDIATGTTVGVSFTF